MYDATNDLTAINESFKLHKEGEYDIEDLRLDIRSILKEAVQDAWSKGYDDGAEDGHREGLEEGREEGVQVSHLENIIYEADGQRMEGKDAESVLAWVKERIIE